MYVFPCTKSSIVTVCIKWKGLGKEGNFITKKEFTKNGILLHKKNLHEKEFFLQKKEVTYTENKIRKGNEK